jgi:hypothetical protein
MNNEGYDSFESVLNNGMQEARTYRWKKRVL